MLRAVCKPPTEAPRPVTLVQGELDFGTVLERGAGQLRFPRAVRPHDGREGFLLGGGVHGGVRRLVGGPEVGVAGAVGGRVAGGRGVAAGRRWDGAGAGAGAAGAGAAGAGDFEGCYSPTGCLMNGVGLHPLRQLEAAWVSTFEMYLHRSFEGHPQRDSINKNQRLSDPLVRSGSFTSSRSGSLKYQVVVFGGEV